MYKRTSGFTSQVLCQNSTERPCTLCGTLWYPDCITGYTPAISTLGTTNQITPIITSTPIASVTSACETCILRCDGDTINVDGVCQPRPRVATTRVGIGTAIAIIVVIIILIAYAYYYYTYATVTPVTNFVFGSTTAGTDAYGAFEHKELIYV